MADGTRSSDHRQHGLEQLQGTANGLVFVSVAVGVAGLWLGGSAWSNVSEGGEIVFASTAGPFLVAAAVLAAARAVVMAAYWRLALDD